MARKSVIVQAVCTSCDEEHVTSAKYLSKLRLSAQKYICADCRDYFKRNAKKTFTQLEGINHINWFKYNINEGD